MIPATTHKVFSAFCEAVRQRDGDTTASFGFEDLLGRTGLDRSQLQTELELLTKMVLVAPCDPTRREWKLTPMGAAAASNQSTFETLFRR